MSRTGNKRTPLSSCGFLLVEVMVAAAVLATGILVIYPALFVSVDAAEIAEDQLYIQMWAQNKLWEEQEAYGRIGTVETSVEKGDFQIGSRLVRWEKAVEARGDSLQEASLVFTWTLGGRPRHVTYSAYLVR